jgi:hypothetical protein
MAKAIWRACAELQLAIEARRVGETKLSDAWDAALIPKPVKPLLYDDPVVKILTSPAALTREERREAQDAAAKKRTESY